MHYTGPTSQRHSSLQTLSQSRRLFLKGLTSAVAGTILFSPFNALATFSTERRLSFHHTHTDEKLDAVYFSNGNYVQDTLSEINTLMRDHRTDEMHPMDPTLLDILHTLHALSRPVEPFQIISGYRSPSTNSMLRRKNRSVAKQSYHMLGKAIDIRLPNVNTKLLRNLAVALKQGGVGYYSKSDFVHIDTGRVRAW